MKIRLRRTTRMAAAVLLAGVLSATAGSMGDIELSPPDTKGGGPLLELLAQRQSARAFAPRALPERVLSNLLWAAWGINRKETGGRTAPSAKDRQEIDVYVVRAEGAYVYRAETHDLKSVAAKDLRPLTGQQPFVATAPMHLVYVADAAASAGRTDDEKTLFAGITAGCIIQNVYLFCASEGLATVARAAPDGTDLAEALGLRDGQRVIMTQTLGYPPE